MDIRKILAFTAGFGILYYATSTKSNRSVNMNGPTPSKTTQRPFVAAGNGGYKPKLPTAATVRDRVLGREIVSKLKGKTMVGTPAVVNTPDGQVVEAVFTDGTVQTVPKEQVDAARNRLKNLAKLQQQRIRNMWKR